LQVVKTLFGDHISPVAVAPSCLQATVVLQYSFHLTRLVRSFISFCPRPFLLSPVPTRTMRSLLYIIPFAWLRPRGTDTDPPNIENPPLSVRVLPFQIPCYARYDSPSRTVGVPTRIWVATSTHTHLPPSPSPPFAFPSVGQGHGDDFHHRSTTVETSDTCVMGTTSSKVLTTLFNTSPFIDQSYIDNGEQPFKKTGPDCPQPVATDLNTHTASPSCVQLLTLSVSRRRAMVATWDLTPMYVKIALAFHLTCHCFSIATWAGPLPTRHPLAWSYDKGREKVAHS